ncbi:MAG: [FeFe] hydrogenase H-cluster radical SAM maturase HydG [Deltaproteobacteria bacterium]|nr:[FeFe] hydrogenase H-cluster radical SAM maturase HydG [Deltaproteobacteria bacterium]
MLMPRREPIVNDKYIRQVLSRERDEDDVWVHEILAKARDLKGLNQSDMIGLMSIQSSALLNSLFETARYVKDSIYGKRLVVFAPMYISNLCRNECTYCAFRANNHEISRRTLTQEEIAEETRALVRTGHKRVLLVAGEAYPKEGFQYVLDAIDTIYSVREDHGEIRRVNVNVAPLTDSEFALLKQKKVGTYQLFQETYNRKVYKEVHCSGKKADYDWRLGAMDRALTAGLGDVGIGVLFGLCDWRYEMLALKSHIEYLERRYGIGPHTISVPRLEPADGSVISAAPPAPVDDATFQKLVAILRIAVPYTGIIMSTRETPSLRRKSFDVGVSQISAGSRTNPGGYSRDAGDDACQFSLGDHRPLDEVIRDVATLGYLPSFCTSCYRLGRVGGDFMDMAKPGDIRQHCDPNGVATFKEYLTDYASSETQRIGEKCISDALDKMDEHPRAIAEKMLVKVHQGKRDVYC